MRADLLGEKISAAIKRVVTRNRPISVSTSVRKTQNVTFRHVSLAKCVHYCAFRYGNNEYNPYETYLIGFEAGRSLKSLKDEFVDFLMYYRPENIAESLGLNPLSKDYPLWTFPWVDWPAESFQDKRGWTESVEHIPDILTHFSSVGIKKKRIDEEFMWLDRALESIRNEGYLPEKHGCYVSSSTFQRENGDEAYLLLDGNHRVAAMVALGFHEVLIQQDATNMVREIDCDDWWAVRNHHYSKIDALSVFGAYFAGNRSYRTSKVPADVILT